MIKVYNKNTSYIVIGNKHIAPFKSETFEARTAMIRALERNGIVKVTQIEEKPINPTTPEVFDYEASKENIAKIKNEKKVEEVPENKTKSVSANQETKKPRTRRTTSKKGEKK